MHPSTTPDTLNSFIAEYEKYIEQLAAPTRAKYRAHLKNHVLPAFGHCEMNAISTKDIELWLAAKPLAWATRCDLRNLLSSIYTVATRWGDFAGINPAHRASVGRKRVMRERRKLSSIQIHNLLSELPHDVSLIVQMALFCTLRISEILGLTWQHVDLARGVVHVRQRYWRGDLDVTKSDCASRTVPLGILAAQLAALPGEHVPKAFVFQVRTRRGYTRSDTTIASSFLVPAAKRLGLYYPGFGFHSFRREAVTGIAAESDALQAMRLAGHSRMDTTLLYGLDDLPRQTAAIERLQAAIYRDPV